MDALCGPISGSDGPCDGGLPSMLLLRVLPGRAGLFQSFPFVVGRVGDVLKLEPTTAEVEPVLA